MSNQLLPQAIATLKAGRRAEGRRLLEDAVQADPRSERGWLWLSEAVDTDEERRFCMTQVLSVNPGNAVARRGLGALGPGPAQSPLLLQVAGAIEARSRAEVRRSLVDAGQTGPGSQQGGRPVAGETRSLLGHLLSIVPAAKPGGGPDGRGMATAAIETLPSPLPGGQAAPGVGAPRRAVVSGRPGEGWSAAVGGRPLLIAWAYLIALAAAEELTALSDPRIGMAVYGGLLAALILHTALNWRQPFYKLFLSLTFAPLIRLLSLSLPLAGFPLLYWYLITSLPLLATAVLMARTLGFSWSAVGLTLRGWPIQILVGLTGLAFGYVEYRLLKPEPLVEAVTWQELWVPALILLVCTGFAEELVFRGVMQRATTEAMGRLGGVYVAGLFAVLHIGHRSWQDVLFVFAVALFFSWVVDRTKSLLGVALSHGLTNVTLFLVFPLWPLLSGR